MSAARKILARKIVLPAILLFCLSLVASVPPVWANNPPAAPCGLPYEGEIVATAVYLVTEDCDPSGQLVVTNQAEVTLISSGGYRYRLAIASGKVHLHTIGASQDDTTTLTYDRGIIIYNPSQRRSRPVDCFQSLGGIGLICRAPEPELMLDIYGITPEREANLLLQVTQTEVDTVTLGSFVSQTEDGRLAIRRGQDSHIIISLGPDAEGQVHHVILEDDLKGRVIGTSVTLGGLPGAAADTEATNRPRIIEPVASTPQEPREDGSLIHVVLPGENAYRIARAYGISLEELLQRNQLADNGRWIQPGQELFIFAAPITLPAPPDEAAAVPETPEEPTTPVADEAEECPETPYIVREDQIIHIVRPGENLANLTVFYGVNIDEVVALNRLPNRGRILQPGQELIIRAANPVEINAAAASAASCPEAPPDHDAGPIIHVVRPGDTIYLIAQIYGLSMDEIVELNQLANRGRVIYPGQELVIRE